MIHQSIESANLTVSHAHEMTQQEVPPFLLRGNCLIFLSVLVM
jgi:hypothetical protein